MSGGLAHRTFPSFVSTAGAAGWLAPDGIARHPFTHFCFHFPTKKKTAQMQMEMDRKCVCFYEGSFLHFFILFLLEMISNELQKIAFEHGFS